MTTSARFAAFIAVLGIAALIALLEWRSQHGAASKVVNAVPITIGSAPPTLFSSPRAGAAASSAPNGARTPLPVTATAPAASPRAGAAASSAPNGARTPLPVTATAPAAPSTQAIAPLDAPPKILSIALSSGVVSPGQTVSGTVTTSSNVASVEARIGGYSTSLAKDGVGRFVMAYPVPNVPSRFRGTYTVEVIARNTHGDETTTQVPITIR